MRTLLRTLSFSTVTLMTLAGTAVANECVDLANAMKNVQIDVDTSDFRQYIFKTHCEVNGSVKTSSSAIDIEAVVKKIPTKLAGSSGSSQQKMQRFCSNYAVDSASYTYSNQSFERLADNAYKTIQACLAFKAKGSRITHTMETLRQSTFFIDAGRDGVEISGLSIAPDDHVTCEGIQPGDDQSSVIDKNSKVTVDKTFSFTCTRSPSATDAQGDTFEEAEIIVRNDIEPYSVIMPADFQFTPNRASDIATDITAMKANYDSRLASADAQLATLNKTTLQTGKYVLPSNAKCRHELEVKFVTAFATTPNLFFGETHVDAESGTHPYLVPEVKVISKNRSGFKFHYCGIAAQSRNSPGGGAGSVQWGPYIRLKKTVSTFQWVAVAIEN